MVEAVALSETHVEILPFHPQGFALRLPHVSQDILTDTSEKNGCKEAKYSIGRRFFRSQLSLGAIDSQASIVAAGSRYRTGLV
jgi:hypothetical protein